MYQDDPRIRQMVNDLANRVVLGGESPKTFQSENDLQAFLIAELDNTPLGGEWTLVDREFNCEGAGRIDLLLKHRHEPKYLVVELKNHDRPEEAVCQVLKYLGWVETRLLQPDESASGLIICTGVSPTMKYALAAIQDRVKCLTYTIHLSLTVVEAA